MLALKVSDVDKPLVSVAVTLMLRLPLPAGGAPVNVSVAALNASHDGSAEPLERVAP